LEYSLGEVLQRVSVSLRIRSHPSVYSGVSYTLTLSRRCSGDVKKYQHLSYLGAFQQLHVDVTVVQPDVQVEPMAPNDLGFPYLLDLVEIPTQV
jgi:hypothetical protein